ncbi:MAG: PQQ-dependent sugar dehydrogenase [Anaerolineales bacterium]|jgi:glucose/arabinose dehydrogenase|nr:PQQ-dependent sugar dehydrogenase [Anaerolineales bacterium]
MKQILGLILIVFLLTACGGSATPTSQIEPASATEMPSVEVALEPTSDLASPSPKPGVEAAASPSPSPAIAPTTGEIEATGSIDAFPDSTEYEWRLITSNLNRPIFLTHAGDGTGQLFILEQPGLIRILQKDTLVETPFLDLRDKVGSQANEQGLLGLAFHPDYPSNGWFFVNYTDLGGDTVIARFQVDSTDSLRADPNSELILLKVAQPYANHNGGMLAFGPDGLLYIGLGDGGSAGDPQNNAQSLQSRLGKILRVDVNDSTGYSAPESNRFSDGQQAEIWAYGLRNPWRFSFDRLTGDLYIGDVGQNQWEEINYLPADWPAGANFGWVYYEGTHPYQAVPPGLEAIGPIFEYGHNQGCSVTGGIVYRGELLPDWFGIYLFADYCSGNISGLLATPQGEWQSKLLFENIGRITSFGEDEPGEIYVVEHTGSIFRLSKK